MVKYLSSWVIRFLLNELKKPSSDELLELLNQKAASSWYHIFCDGHPNGSVKFPFHCHGSKYIKLGHNFHAGAGFRIEAWDCYQDSNYTPEIRIGDNCCINNNVHIGAINRIWVGDNVLIGSNVLITDHTHGNCKMNDLLIPPIKRKLYSKGPVIIEDDVLIGENVSILPGCTIGKGAVLGAGAVVTSDIPPYSVAVGVPAKARIIK
jgi:acetyltransferase-like isoleucine patch superfamily enzyme